MKTKMETKNSQRTVLETAGIVAAGARLDSAVDLLGMLLVPVQPLASDESGVIEAELADPLYSEWQERCDAPVHPIGNVAAFMHQIAWEIELLTARIRLCDVLRPILDVELPPFPRLALLES